MKNILLAILLFTPVLLISCQPEQSSQYFLTFRWPADTINKVQNASLLLRPGLEVNDDVLLGMVSKVAEYRIDSIDVTIMVDKKIPIGSKIIFNYSRCSQGIYFRFSKEHRYYCPGDIISGNITLEAQGVCL